MDIKKQIQEILRDQYIIAKTVQSGIETASSEILKLIEDNYTPKINETEIIDAINKETKDMYPKKGTISL